MYSGRCSGKTSVSCRYCHTKFDDRTNQNAANEVIEMINDLEESFSSLQDIINSYKNLIPRDNGELDALGLSIEASLQELYDNEKVTDDFSKYDTMLDKIIKEAENNDRDKNTNDCSSHESRCSANPSNQKVEYE